MEKIKNIFQNKKTLLILIVAIILLCLSYLLIFNKQDAYITHVKDGNKTVATTKDGTKIEKDYLYHYILKNSSSTSSEATYGSSQIISEALSYIADKEITDTKAINDETEKLKKQYASYIQTSLAEYAKKLGFSSEEEYIKEALVPDAKQSLLKNKYIKEQLKDLTKEYKVRYLKIITVQTESAAQKIIDSSKDEASFNKLLVENKGVDAGFVNKSTSESVVDKKILSKLDNFTKDGIYKEVIKTSDSKYSVIWVYNSDYSKVKDSIIDNFNNNSDILTKMEGYYLQKYNFEVNEPKIKELIKKSNKDFFK